MRVCIPTTGDKGLDERVGEHFNKAITYTIVDLTKNTVESIKNSGDESYALKLMEEKGIEAIICSHIGYSILPTLEERGIVVYLGAYGRVKDAIRMWKSEMLHLATTKKK